MFPTPLIVVFGHLSPQFTYVMQFCSMPIAQFLVTVFVHLTSLLYLSLQFYHECELYMLIGLLMFMSQTSLFTQFKETYLKVQIQERSFVNVRPFYVRALK
jgi:hypothetical protein